MPYTTKLDVIYIPTAGGASGAAQGTAITLRDGAPHNDGTWNWRNLTKEQFEEMNADVEKFLGKQKDFNSATNSMENQSYHDMHKFQKDFAALMLNWGDEHEKKGKGK